MSEQSKLSELADRLEEHNCPRPIDENITVGACFKAGTCGCEERETIEAAAALREAEMVLRECLPIVAADAGAAHMMDGLGEIVDGVPTGNVIHRSQDDLLAKVRKLLG